MRKVIYSMPVSLDGYIEGPNGDFDWSKPDNELHQHFNDQELETGLHLYGRRLYEVMGYWRTVDINGPDPLVEREFAARWREVPTIVFSRTLSHVEGNATLIQDDIAGFIKRQKAQEGKDLVLGGAGIGATFIRLGLVDEYRLYVFPVVLGRGKPFFPALDKPLKLHLVATQTFGSGVVLLRYRPADDGLG